MSSIIPSKIAGGLPIRDENGNLNNNQNIQNSYNPSQSYKINGSLNYLPSDCTARILPEQINAFQSELIALAEELTPKGEWDSEKLNNLSASFTKWWNLNKPDLTEVMNKTAKLNKENTFTEKNTFSKGILITTPDTGSKIYGNLEFDFTNTYGAAYIYSNLNGNKTTIASINTTSGFQFYQRIILKNEFIETTGSSGYIATRGNFSSIFTAGTNSSIFTAGQRSSIYTRGKNSHIIAGTDSDTVAADPFKINVFKTNGQLVGYGEAIRGLMLGVIYQSPTTITPKGSLDANGGEYLRSDYPDLWQFAKNSGLIVSDAEWLDNTQKKWQNWSEGDGSTTFRVPDCSRPLNDNQPIPIFPYYIRAI